MEADLQLFVSQLVNITNPEKVEEANKYVIELIEHETTKALQMSVFVVMTDNSRIDVKQTTHLVNLRTVEPHLPVQLRQFDVNNFVSKAFNSRSMADFNSTRYLEIQRQKSLQHVPLYFI